MLANIVGGLVNRLLIGLIDFDSQRLGCQRVHVGARAQGVLAHVGPGEVWLNSRRSFSHQRNSSRRRDGGDFVVARCQRRLQRNANLVVKKVGIGFAVGFQLGKRTAFRTKTKTFDPGLASEPVVIGATDRASSIAIKHNAPQESLTVRPEALDKEIEELAARFGRTPAAVRAQLEKDGSISRIYMGLRREMAVDFAMARAKITTA